SPPLATPANTTEIDPGARDRTVMEQSPLLNLNSARLQITSVVQLSFMGMGTDLIGRPSQTGFHGMSPELANSSPNDSMPLGGVTQGQQQGMFREISMRRESTQPGVLDIALAVIPARSDLMAADYHIDPSRVMLRIGGLIDWALRMTTSGRPRI